MTKAYFDLFHHIRTKLPRGPKVLEVGCGNGFFLEALRKKRIVDVWGVEPGKQMIHEAPKYLLNRIKNDIFKRNQFARNSFDAVCCFHTLDHMTDPNLFAEESLRILKPGGFVLVVVHDTGGWSVKLFGERSPIFDIEHIYLFNKQNLWQLFANAGFTATEVNNLVNTYPISYWLRMSGIPQVVKTLSQKILDTVKLSQVRFSFAGGNIYLIAQKPK